MYPELARDLIREANRYDITANGVNEIFELAEHLLGLADGPEDAALITGETVVEFWRESFEED